MIAHPHHALSGLPCSLFPFPGAMPPAMRTTGPLARTAEAEVITIPGQRPIHSKSLAQAERRARNGARSTSIIPKTPQGQPFAVRCSVKGQIAGPLGLNDFRRDSIRLQIGRMICDGVCPVIPGCHGRKGLSFLLIELNGLFDDLTKLGKHCLFIITVATAVEQPRATADKATVLFRPFDNFHISAGLIHDPDSSIARLTARSWYCLASSLGFPEIATGLVTPGWT